MDFNLIAAHWIRLMFAGRGTTRCEGRRIGTLARRTLVFPQLRAAWLRQPRTSTQHVAALSRVHAPEAAVTWPHACRSIASTQLREVAFAKFTASPGTDCRPLCLGEAQFGAANLSRGRFRKIGKFESAYSFVWRQHLANMAKN